MAHKSLALLLVIAAAAIGQVRCYYLPPGVSPLVGYEAIMGRVPCSNGSSIDAKTARPFPNAVVQLVCGGYRVVNVTTDAYGAFGFFTGKIPNINRVFTDLVHKQCRVDVITPLAACDESLADATGTLSAPVRIVGKYGLVAGMVGLDVRPVTFAAKDFTFVPSSM